MFTFVAWFSEREGEGRETDKESESESIVRALNRTEKGEGEMETSNENTSAIILLARISCKIYRNAIFQIRYGRPAAATTKR